MKVLLFIIIGAIVVFLAVFYILTVMDRLVSQLSKSYIDTATKKARLSTPRVKRFLNNLFLVGALLGISLTLLIMINKIAGEGLFKKVDKKPIIAKKTLLDSLQIHLADNVIPAQTDTPPSSNLKKGILDDVLMPATIEKSPVSDQDSKEMASPLKTKEDAFLFTISGSKKGDIFVQAFYDQAYNGAFIKSDGLRFAQSAPMDSQAIRIDMRVPALNEKQTIQLPFLLNGYVIAQSDENGAYILKGDGKFTALKKTDEFDLVYFIKRCEKPPDVYSGKTSDNWISKEFKDIPSEILNILKAAQDKSEFIKLGATAVILNAYFGYQADVKEVVLHKGKTWNNMLNDTMALNRRLLCDCDVLSMFAFIYLKFLQLDPIILAGYINKEDAKEFSPPAQMHSTIYVKTGKGSVIFEPTLFTTNFTSVLRNADPGKEGMDYSDIAVDTDKVEDVVSGSDIKYFVLPDDLMTKLEYTAYSQLEPKTALFLADLLLIEKEQNKAAPKKEPQGNSISANIAKISIILYVLIILFTKLFLLAQNSEKRIFPLKRPYSLLFIISFFTILINTFFHLSFTNPKVGIFSKMVSYGGMILCATATLISSILIINFVAEKRDPQDKGGKFFKIGVENLYVITGLILGLAALLCAPSRITFIALLIMAFALLAYGRRLLRKLPLLVFIVFIMTNTFTPVADAFKTNIVTKDVKTEGEPAYYKPYLKLLEDVFNTMNNNYYKPVSKAVYEQYVEKFKKSVLSKIKIRRRRIDNIAYAGAGLLVNQLKDPKDSFTNFIPPKIAKEYSKEIYGYEYGIGISGAITDKGYLIDHVQIRSDAYTKNIRANDLILKIDGKDVKTLTVDEIKNLLYPPLETTVSLELFLSEKNMVSSCDVLCKEYFIETVREVPIDTPDVYCLKIASFNRKTGDDLKGYVKTLETKGIKLLVLDLTDNPGGPPLAVQELTGIFFEPQTKLFYYKKKNTPPFGLASPLSETQYNGKMVIIVNKKSGSSSELLAGVCKAYKRAIIVGKEPTAGFAFLKSTFNFDSGSMLVMLTGLTYLFDGTEVSMDGINPDLTIPEEVQDVVQYTLDKYKSGGLF
jgi:C-terminal peptidase prc